MSRSFRAEILENASRGPHFKLLTVRPLAETLPPEPGRFYMLQAGDNYDPLLKRPFSIFTADGGLLAFLYRIRGKGTLSLSHLKEGALIHMVGPLGTRYPLPEGDFIAVAGGVGIASLFPLMAAHQGRVRLFYGARSADELVFADEASNIVKGVTLATDDGSRGEPGLVTEHLQRYFRSAPESGRGLPVYACGPTPMLKAVAQTADEWGAPCYVSLEEHMACGIGACLGCMVKTVSGQKRVCKEGPVFNSKDILW